MSATPAEWDRAESKPDWADDTRDSWDYSQGPHPLDLEELNQEDDDLYQALMEDFDTAYQKLWGDAA